MRWLSFVVAVALVTNVGCSGKKTEAEGEGGKKLGLKAPGNTSIKQGEKKTVTVSIERTKFDEPVDVTLENLPDGVTAEKSSAKIEKGQKEANFTLTAKDDAKLVKGQKVKVTAKGGGMSAPDSEFTLDVEAKDK